MKFRTEITCSSCNKKIAADEKLLFIGSCFSVEIGRCLAERGFDISVNPFGPLYNPLSIANCLERAAQRRYYDETDLANGPRTYHCLDYATRFSGENADEILRDVNACIESVGKRIEEGALVFVTLGTSFIYELADSGKLVGNCHKFPAAMFNRRRIDVVEAVSALRRIVDILKDNGARALYSQ